MKKPMQGVVIPGYTVWLNNFHFWAHGGREHTSLTSALEAAKKIGFEATVYIADQPIAYFSPTAGVRRAA